MKKQTQREQPGTAVDVIEQQVIEGQVVQFNDRIAISIRDARTLHKRLKQDYLEGIEDIAEQIIAAKRAAKAQGTAFSTLFGDPDDESKFPFTQQWANSLVRIHESRILKAGFQNLPADVSALATLASATKEQRPSLLARYYELTVKVAEPTAEEVKVAKRAIAREDEKKAKKPMRPREAMRQAKVEVTGRAPMAAPEGDRDVKAETRKFCQGMTNLMLSQVLAEVKAIIEERRP